LIDSIVFEKQNRDVSYGRYPDGSPNWEYLSISTPGRSNGKESGESESSTLSAMVLAFLIMVAIVLLIISGKLRAKRRDDDSP